jgi:hypothetical protein
MAWGLGVMTRGAIDRVVADPRCDPPFLRSSNRLTKSKPNSHCVSMRCWRSSACGDAARNCALVPCEVTRFWGAAVIAHDARTVRFVPRQGHARVCAANRHRATLTSTRERLVLHALHSLRPLPDVARIRIRGCRSHHVLPPTVYVVRSNDGTELCRTGDSFPRRSSVEPPI